VTSPDGLIYVIGGREEKSDGSAGPTTRVDVYSPHQNKWWTVPPTQVPHLGGAAATGRNRIFEIGGSLDGAGIVESRRSFCSVCQ
jgi:hypothetical protein